MSFFYAYFVTILFNLLCLFCYRELLFDDEGNLLDEKPKDSMNVAMRKKISDLHNKFEDLIQMAKNSEQGMDFLYSTLSNLVEPLQKIMPAASDNKQDEYESFLDSKIPNEVNIHPPNDVKSKGRCKRIKKSKNVKAPSKRKCGKCKKYEIMMHTIAQTILLADILSSCNVVRYFGMLLVKHFSI